jgi:GMP synthase (glutamine-hydrolysing)
MARLRLLVADGNIREVRERVARLTGSTPSQSYAAVLGEIAPDAVIDVVLPADPGANLPDPAGLAGYDGVAITGSALNIHKEDEPSLAQVAFARAIFASGVPFFGSCWGLQVATVAAGGTVRINPKGREVAFARKIALTAEGAGHPLHEGRPAVFDAPAVHMDEVGERPPGMVVTATNAVSDVQAATIRHDAGTFWGVQYHPEYGLADIAAVVERYRPILQAEGLAADDDAVTAIVSDLQTLAAAPDRRDLAWRYGLDRDVLDRQARTAELRNWIEHQVRPAASARGRA